MAGENSPPPTPAPENPPCAEIIDLQRHPLWLTAPPSRLPAAGREIPAEPFRQIQERLEGLDQDLRGLRQHYTRVLNELAALARRSGRERSFETLAAAVDVSFNAILRLCEEATAGDSPADPAGRPPEARPFRYRPARKPQEWPRRVRVERGDTGPTLSLLSSRLFAVPRRFADETRVFSPLPE